MKITLHFTLLKELECLLRLLQIYIYLKARYICIGTLCLQHSFLDYSHEMIFFNEEATLPSASTTFPGTVFLCGGGRIQIPVGNTWAHCSWEQRPGATLRRVAVRPPLGGLRRPAAYVRRTIIQHASFLLVKSDRYTYACTCGIRRCAFFAGGVRIDM
jgi:hypothetical protein